MSHSDKVHYNPPLCFNIPMVERISEQEFKIPDITMSTNLEEVTCRECVYYKLHPEARELERKMRLARLYG